MKRRNLIPVAAVLLLLGSTHAPAQIIKRAQAGFRFLENPISAEAIGRGGVGVAMITNSNAVFWNPAGIGWITQRADLSVNYTRGIADINYASSSLAIRLWNIGVVALNTTVMDYGEFYGTRRATNEAGYIETGVFSPKAFALGIAFSQKVSERFSYGVNLKYAYQNLGDVWVGTAGKDVGDPDLQMETRSYTHGEPALDIGAYYDFLFHGIRFGASLQNLSREIQYETEKFPMPFAVNFGMTIDPLSFLLPPENNAHSLMVSIESRHPRDYNEKVKAGIEYTFENSLALRIGYTGGYDERGFTAGLGVKQTLGGVSLRVDYAYQAFGIFGAAHFFSFGAAY